ncbi:hypothetical protein VSR01_04960 [Actinacidiphila sp. DG2A-62]|uniref:hypothetical protein n=1 Tax=Actinacidiphila sp. DG2A-62 TaxID=3108821 RepID=UPI002DB5F8A0|nr:hypothetical protein [Actinacidiphila sp. DG2A-62]MEC3992929.1 hypothetical protein [Actinacidiphila sp. DG2A-62]
MTSRTPAAPAGPRDDERRAARAVLRGEADMRERTAAVVPAARHEVILVSRAARRRLRGRPGSP